MDQINKIYCCDKMKEEEWYLEIEDNKVRLQEDYSVHFIENAAYCPWCGKSFDTIVNKMN